MKTSSRICVIGSANVDLPFRTPRFPLAGETIKGHALHQGLGGKGANQAVAAARLGADVSLVACVGDDAFGVEASGHAFVSAIPFITAAKMTDNPWEKTFWYAGSTLGGLSRINDNAHYTSQVGLGWTLAFVAASAVDQTDTGKKGWSVISKSTGPDSGVAIQYRW